jgi:outer membrane protein TolC
VKTRAFVTISFAICAALVGERSAHATQPLEEFVEKSRTHSFDAREAAATVRQREAEADAALGRLLPAFSARGVYTRNQYEVAAQLPGSPNRLVIVPENQWDAFFQLDVPIVDLGSFYRYRAARAIERSTNEQQAATFIDTARNVARAYYQHVAAYGLLKSAKQSTVAAEVNLGNVEVRRSAGAATELDR